MAGFAGPVRPPILPDFDFEKPGDTVRPWKQKWGVGVPNKVPRALLWWFTDPQMDRSEWQVDILASQGSFALTNPNSSGSPFAVGDKFTVESDMHLLISPSGAALSLGVSILAEEFVPSKVGPPLEIEAQIDVSTSVSCQIAVSVSDGLSIYAAKYVTVGRAEPDHGWARCHLVSPLQGLVRVAGQGMNPLNTGRSYRFGLHITAMPKQKLAPLKLDNFEIRVAASCNREAKAREVAALKERDAADSRLRKIITELRFPESISGVPVSEYSPKQILKEIQDDGETVPSATSRPTLPQMRDCCMDEEVTYGVDGSISPPDGVDPDADAVAHFVEEEVELNSFVTADTSTDAWLQNFPCKRSIGDYVPVELAKLEAQVMEGEPMPKLMDGQEDLPKDLEADDANDAARDPDDVLGSLTRKIAPSPILNPDGTIAVIGDPWVPSGAGDQYAFEGCDICFVHGLKLSHLYDGLVQSDKSLRGIALASWVTPAAPTAASLIAANPGYFRNGYFAVLAKLNWFGDGSAPTTTAPLPAHVQSNLQNVSLPPDVLPPGSSVHLPAGGTPLDGHIGRFLLGNGYRNRFMLASFSCNDRIDKAVEAVLAQISLAMTDGIGVYNPAKVAGKSSVLWTAPGPNVPRYAKDFGARGLVIISHSTGGLVVDIAMTKAMQNAALGVRHVPLHTKAHIASQAAFAGAGMASYAWFVSFLTADKFRTGLKRVFADQSQEKEINKLTSEKDLGKKIMQTILKDLRPAIVALKYRALIRQTPVRTLLIEGGHPTSLFEVKVLLNAGFDDNTICANSAGASRAFPWFWPHGTLTPKPRLNFDLGLFGPELKKLPTVKLGGKFIQLKVTVGTNYLAQPKRAVGYYVDQRIDPLLRLWIRPWEPKQLLPVFQATFVSPFLSPSGMLMAGVPMLSTPHDPYWRSKNHYRFLASAADHFSGTHDQGIGQNPDIDQPNYQATPDAQNSNVVAWFLKLVPGPNVTEQNREESFVVNNPVVYKGFNPAGFTLRPSYWYVKMWDVPLLNANNFPQVFRTRGCYIEFTLRIGKKIRMSRTLWFFRRYYVLLKGWQDMMEFDYVYGRNLHNEMIGGVLRKS